MRRPKLHFFIIFMLLAFMLLPSCGEKDKYDYYADRENYISVTGTVSFVNHSEDGTVLYLEFENLSVPLSDNCFKVVGDNLSILGATVDGATLEIGDDLTFITAPRYFGDGYVMPIVSIKRGEIVLMEFDEGVDNLLNWLNAQ